MGPAMKRMLAAVDNSYHANVVVGQAVELALLMGSDLTVLSVINSDPMATSSIGEEQNKLVRLHRELILKHFPQNSLSVEKDDPTGTVYKYNEKGGFTVQSKILQGEPVDKICAYADEMNADLVVLGTRGLAGLGAIMVNSVSEKVVRKCSRSVLVVKAKGLENPEWQSVHGGQKHRHGIGIR